MKLHREKTYLLVKGIASEAPQRIRQVRWPLRNMKLALLLEALRKQER